MYYYKVIPFEKRIFNLYTYKSENPLTLGQRVFVEMRNKIIPALIFKKDKEEKNIKIKEIEFVIDKKSLLHNNHLRLIEDLSKELFIPYSDIIKLMFPSLNNDLFNLYIIPKSPLSPINKPCKLNDFIKNKKENKKIKEYIKNNLIELELRNKKILINKEKIIYLNKNLNEVLKIKISKSGLNLVNYLNLNGEQLESFLYENDIVKKGSSVIRTLINKNIIKYKEKSDFQKKSNTVVLNKEQNRVLSEIKKSKKNKFILFGVTGSGKTEIFFELIDKYLKLDKQILLLVPEISLTPQIKSRTIKRFPNKNIIFYHSGITNSQKTKNWYDIVNNNVNIIIGTRSAVWIPYNNLGLIIIDEGHDNSFYQYDQISYDTITVAEKISDLNNSFLLYSSATPNVKEYKKYLDKKYDLYELKERFHTQMPEIKIIDMKQAKKYNWIFSKYMLKEVKKTLDNNKKIIIFTPTRGYANYIICTDCGNVIKCKNCDVSMTYHKKELKLKCHYCGEKTSAPEKCPICKNINLQTRGYGTEKVVNDLTRIFPSEEIIRIDRTVIKNYNDLKNTFNYIKEKGKKIIVGTKMITKGLDIEDLDLVVVLDYERYSFFPDYTSYESAAALLIQVSGRSGRKEKGKVLIQTFKPDEDIYDAVTNHNFNKIIFRELEERKEFGYPPFREMILILILNESKEQLNILSLSIIKDIKKIVYDGEILGPVEPIISKIKNKYRNQIYILYNNLSLSSFYQVVQKYDKNIRIYINPPSTFI